MITKCLNCGKEYQLNIGENVGDYQCNCGGNLEERKSIKEYKLNNKYKNKYKEEKAENQKVNVDMDNGNSKEDFYRRGYKLIEEDEGRYIMGKKVSKLPLWALAVIAIVLFPIGVVISLVLYLVYTEPKIKTVHKV